MVLQSDIQAEERQKCERRQWPIDIGRHCKGNFLPGPK